MTQPNASDGGERSELDARRRAFEHAYARHRRKVHQTLWRFGVHRGPDQEDIGHDVFRIGLEKLHEYDPERAEIETWLKGIAWRVASDFRRLRRHRLEIPTDEIDQAPSQSTDPERAACAAEVRATVLDIIDTKIDEDRRAVFAMYELEGCSLSEIGEALDLRESTVKGRLRLAREQFQAEVLRREKARKLSRSDVLALPVPLLSDGGRLLDQLRAAPEADAAECPGADAASAALAGDLSTASAVIKGSAGLSLLHGAALFVSGVMVGAVGLHLALPRAPIDVLPAPSPTHVATADTVASVTSAEPSPLVLPVTVVAPASPTVDPSSEPSRMDKEIVQRMRQQDSAEDRAKLAERHRAAYGDSATSEERDAANAEGAIASGAVDAARAAVEAFRRKYPGSVHQPRLDGLLARKPGTAARGTP